MYNLVMDYHIARINYHYRKLRMTRQRMQVSDAGGNVEFEAYAFFEVCFHLKDWIKTDPRYDVHQDNVDDYINRSKPLCVLHDLCNRLKHRTLTWPKSDVGPFRGVLSIEIGPEGAYHSLSRLEAEVNGDILCMYELADEAMRAWATYFEAHPQLQPASGCELLQV